MPLTAPSCCLQVPSASCSDTDVAVKSSSNDAVESHKPRKSAGSKTARRIMPKEAGKAREGGRGRRRSFGARCNNLNMFEYLRAAAELSAKVPAGGH